MKGKPTQEVYWYTLSTPNIVKLSENISADVVVVGGGMAGLTCAQNLVKKGLSVVLLEKDFCGSGASGKSSGFITPDSELELSDLVNRFGKEKAKELWNFVTDGVEHIRKTINDNNISCDYEIADSLFIADSESGFKRTEIEHKNRISLGYDSKLYDKENISDALGGGKYFGGVRYPGTFGMNSYAYCTTLKSILVDSGVKIYEHSPVTKITNSGVIAGDYTVAAKKIIICVDRFSPEINILKKEIYSAQTFLTISEPLQDTMIKKIFPKDTLMVWDTDLIYQYYRLTGEGRLLLGGSSLLYTYQDFEKEEPGRIVRKLSRYIKNKFSLDISFEYIWPGLIGVTKDFFPIAGRDADFTNVYYIAGVAGLPWAAALGNLIAGHVGDGSFIDAQDYRKDRSFPVSNEVQQVISKPVAFALSHGIVKYFNK